MVTKINKNVLLVKEIPSNLIEEAILILKTDDKKIKQKTKEILMIEANEIINDCSNKLQSEYDNLRKAEREAVNKRRRQKINLISIGGFILFTISIILLARMMW